MGKMLLLVVLCGCAVAGRSLAGEPPPLTADDFNRAFGEAVEPKRKTPPAPSADDGPFVVDADDGGDARLPKPQAQAKPKRPQIARSDEFYQNLYFPPERSVPLTQREQWVLRQVENWQESGFNSNPTYLPDGAVQYVYGTTHPSIVCAPLQLTDIELEPGEILNSLNVGDPARWRFEAALSSSPAGDIQHVLVKPMDTGIATSMVIATNRRTYYLRMKSTQEDFFPRVSFAYPDDVLLKGQIAKEKAEKELADNTLEETGEYLGALNFKYRVTATRRAGDFKPLRVYNDGKKTILEMPESVKSGEMPVLLVVSADGRGNPFRSTETTLVNYRVQSNRFIVDAVFDKAYLVRGVGRVQERVVIEREKAPRRKGAADV